MALYILLLVGIIIHAANGACRKGVKVVPIKRVIFLLAIDISINLFELISTFIEICMAETIELV